MTQILQSDTEHSSCKEENASNIFLKGTDFPNKIEEWKFALLYLCFVAQEHANANVLSSNLFIFIVFQSILMPRINLQQTQHAYLINAPIFFAFFINYPLFIERKILNIHLTQTLASNEFFISLHFTRS